MRVKPARNKIIIYIKLPPKYENSNSSNFYNKSVTIQNLFNLLRDGANMLYFLFNELLYLARCSLPIFNGSKLSQINLN
jgi:hypothetical protein